jgi:hypothetical protein
VSGSQWCTQDFFRGGGEGGSTNSVEGRENGDVGVVAPKSGVPLHFQMSETRVLIKLLRMYFPRNWGGLTPPVRRWYKSVHSVGHYIRGINS